MMQKMSFTFEPELLEELDRQARELGKKKAQIVREALYDYFDALHATQEIDAIRRGESQTIGLNEMRRAVNA